MSTPMGGQSGQSRNFVHPEVDNWLTTRKIAICQ